MAGNFVTDKNGLVIGIVADDRTAKGIKSAQKNVNTLEKSVKNLGKTFAAVFISGRIASYAKNAAKALADDQKAAALLSNTVKNLGLSLSAVDLEKFVQKLQASSSVVDDELRPALQRLLTTTGSVVKSEQLLTQAIDISRGSGIDLATVVSDLSNAYVGSTKGLKKYALGLSQAELKAMAFTDIQKKLNQQFSGSSAAYLDTYAGKLASLNVAAANAKETIGAGLLDAFAALGGGKGTEDAIKNIDALAAGLASIVRLGGQVAGIFMGLYKAIDYVGTLGGLLGPSGSLVNGLKSKASTNRSSSPAGSWKKTQQQRAAEAAAAKRAKELAAAQTKQTKALKDQALLKKQSALFDMDQIQRIAALKGQLTDEERNRVLLQLALIQGNEEEAKRLSVEIANSIDSTGKLAKYLTTLPDANNPFKDWQSYLDGIEATIKRINALNPAPTTPTTPNTPIGPTTPQPAAPGTIDYGGHVIGEEIPNFTPYNYGTNYGLGGSRGDSATSIELKLYMDGKDITAASQLQSMNGNNTTVNRTSGSFNFL